MGRDAATSLEIFDRRILLSASRLRRDEQDVQDLQDETNHGLPGRAPVTPVRCDWQKKSKNLTSLLAEFLFFPCAIRAANAPVPSSIGVG
jgi:hypothetical protein